MMASHPYLRAYMAGIVVPTVFLLLGLTVLTLVRFHVSAPLERVIVFPMAVVPNLWGVWNMLYVRLHRGRWLPIGLHGAILPLFLVPAGFGLAAALGIPWMSASMAALVLPAGAAVYYLVWKHLVGYFNEVLGVA
jgi:hypothetical protein